MIVNVFSQFIKKIADETDTDYADVLKSFQKSKRLQADWKAYRDAKIKSNPYLFRPPVIERVIRFENNVEPITSINIPAPTEDASISVSKDTDNSIIVTEEDLGGQEETKEEDNDRLNKLVENLEINPISSRPSQPVKPPSKSDKPLSKKSNVELEENLKDKEISNTIRSGGRGSIDIKHTWDIVCVDKAIEPKVEIEAYTNDKYEKKIIFFISD
jgi:hypothetical protein